MPPLKAFKPLLGPMRLPFLILTPACVAVGVGTAYWQQHSLHASWVALVLLGALASHISVNAFNEYFDFRSGLDAITVRTPFSGGSGTLPSQPALAPRTLLLALVSLAVAAGVGLFFIQQHGWGLAPLGLFGLFLLVTYTTWWAYHPWLCLLAPGLGFGVLMVLGTHFALTGSYSWPAFWAALLPSCFVSNLLLLNQFPDLEADRKIGRKNLPILLGRPRSASVYGLLLGLGYASVLIAVMAKFLPPLGLLALLTTPLAWMTYRGARQHADDIPALLPAMGQNVVLNIVTPLLLALGLLLS